jgi:hypothetical protein
LPEPAATAPGTVELLARLSTNQNLVMCAKVFCVVPAIGSLCEADPELVKKMAFCNKFRDHRQTSSIPTQSRRLSYIDAFFATSAHSSL